MTTTGCTATAFRVIVSNDKSLKKFQSPRLHEEKSYIRKVFTIILNEYTLVFYRKIFEAFNIQNTPIGN